MLEILYRIYEVADEETAVKNRQINIDLGFYSSTSKMDNIELVMDVKICDSRDQFKEIIRGEWGQDIAFAYSKKKLKPGDHYCIIIGEHCYDTQRYFEKVSFTCDYCGAKVETYVKKNIGISDFTIRHDLFGIEEYKTKRFCSDRCSFHYVAQEKARISPDDEKEFWVTRDMFTQTNVAGYIYLITKKSTGQFYVGQTIYAPIFRWGQHLKGTRFPIQEILDYQFEVIEIVPKGENILEREKYWIQKKYLEDPEKSLNISCTANLSEGGKEGEI